MESEVGKRLPDRLRQLRQKAELTQEEFAEKARLGYKYYQQIEAGRKEDIRISTLERLARGHGLEIWELLMPASLAAYLAEAKGEYAKKPRKK